MGFLVYEQRLSMYWFSVWISGGSLMESVHPSSHAWDVHVIIGCFHTKGWTNHLDRQIVGHLSFWCEFMSYCRWLIRLAGQIVLEKSSLSADLFVLFAHRMICSSETIRPSKRLVSNRMICSSEMIWPFRRFVCPLVWNWPLSCISWN